MFNEDTLKKYIKSIDFEKALSMERVLPLYKYGFVIKEENLRELKIHTGFQNTIRRYIENPQSLTRRELVCILRLYSIEHPEVSPVLPPEVLEILFSPKPQIELDKDDVIILTEITFSPKPVITISIEDVDVIIEFAPVPQVNIDEAITLLTFSPVPQILLDNQILIEYAPKAQIILDEGTVIPQYPVMDYAPHPWIVSIDELAPIVNYVPKSQVKLEIDIAVGDVIYWGVMERTSSDPRPTASDFEFDDTGISSITLPGNTPDNLLLSFNSSIKGYIMFAIPESAPSRQSYRDPNNFEGNIGGSPGPFGNLWPDAEIKFNDIIPIPKNYKVYITSYWTQPVSGNYVLRSSPL